MKKTLSVLLSLLMVISITFGMDFSALADDSTDEDTPKVNTTYFIDKANKVIEIDAKGEETGEAYSFMSQSDYEEVTVNNCYSLVIKNATKVSDYAFGGMFFSSITFDDKLEEIGDYAFNGVGEFTGVLDTKNVKKIGKYAFEGCSEYQTLITNAEEIGANAFRNNDSLKNVTLKNTSTIQNQAFAGCKSLEEISFALSTKFIGSQMFDNCYSLETVIIPNGCETAIGDRIFRNCKKILKFYVPNTVEDVGSSVFIGIPNATRKTFAVITTEGSYIQKVAKDAVINCNTNAGVVKVNFDAGRGTCTESERTYNIGDVYGELPTATADNADFLGWDNQEWGCDVFEDDVVYGRNHTLTAMYEEKTYTVIFKTNGGTMADNLKTMEIQYYDKYGKLPKPTKTGYKFIGWFDIKGNQITEDTQYLETQDTVLYARYEANQYTLKLYVTSYVGVNKQYDLLDTVELKYDEEYILPLSRDIMPEANKDKDFFGWSTSSSGIISYGDGETVKNLTSKDGETVALYATWSSYAIKPINELQTVKLDASQLANANKYKFGFTTPKSGDYQLKFSGNVKKVYIENKLGASVATIDNSNSMNEIVTLQNLNRGTYVVTFETKSVPTTVNFIVTSVSAVPIHFDANGGTLESYTKEYANGEQYGNLPVPNKTGYKFAGWFDSNDNQVSDTDIVDGVATLTAHWSPIVYKVQYFNLAGQKLPVSQSFTYDVEGRLKTGAEVGVANAKPNYIFAGWATARNKDSVDYKDGAVMFNERSTASTISLYPVYIPGDVVITINYYDADKQFIGRQTVGNNTTVNLKTAIDLGYRKTGYTLAGWSDSSVSSDIKYTDGAKVDIATNKVSIGLYAVLKPITYNVVFHDMDDGILSQFDASYDNEYYIPKYNSYIPNGYRNAGWTTNPNETAVEYKEGAKFKNLSSTQDDIIEFYPVIKKSGKFEVTVYEFGYARRLMSSYTASWDDDTFTFPLIDNVRQEYVDKYFVGWNLDKDSTMPDYLPGDTIDADYIEGDITLYGIWSKNMVLVSFRNGNTSTSKYMPSGDYLGELPTLEKSGYNFLGWFTEETDGFKIDENYVVPEDEEKVEFYAHFEKIAEYVNLKIDDIQAVGDDDSDDVVEYAWSNLTDAEKNIKAEKGTKYSYYLPKNLKLKGVESSSDAPFLGWFNECWDKDDQLNTNGTVQNNKTVYPLWNITRISDVTIKPTREFRVGTTVNRQHFIVTLSINGSKKVNADWVNIDKTYLDEEGQQVINFDIYYGYGLVTKSFVIDVKPEQDTTKPSEPDTTEPTKPSEPDTTEPTKPSEPDTTEPTKPSQPDTTKPTGIGHIDDEDDVSQNPTKPSTEPSSSVTNPSTAPSQSTSQVTATTKASTTQTTQTTATTTLPYPSQTAKAATKVTVKKPKKTSVKKVSKGKNKATVYWAKTSGVKGYQVQIATDKKFKKNRKTVTIKKQKTTKTTLKKLKSKKTYFVRVRTYKTVNGKKVYSAWSKTKSFKVK